MAKQREGYYYELSWTGYWQAFKDLATWFWPSKVGLRFWATIEDLRTNIPMEEEPCSGPRSVIT